MCVWGGGERGRGRMRERKRRAETVLNPWMSSPVAEAKDSRSVVYVWAHAHADKDGETECSADQTRVQGTLINRGVSSGPCPEALNT